MFIHGSAIYACCMTRAARCVVSLAVVIAVAFPVLGSPFRDSFPLSTYPMFSVARPQQATVNSAVGFDGAGAELTLRPLDIGGTREVIQAAATISRPISRGETDELCEEVLSKVEEAAVIEIVTETYDVVAYFDDDQDPLQRIVHARCTS